MLALLQRVQQASVTINEKSVATIEKGLLILCGFESHDTQASSEELLNKCLNYRVFSDEQGKMNLSLKTIQGGLLLVPQFTLAANTQSGLRPSFSLAAPPAQGEKLFTSLCQFVKKNHTSCTFGQFGKNMQVFLCNDGPVTFLLQN